MKKNFICSKKSVRTFKLRIEPYFFEPRGAWKTLLDSEFGGGMRSVAPSARPHFGSKIRFRFLAERVRFELTIPFRIFRFSRPVHSTALPSLQKHFVRQNVRTIIPVFAGLI